MRKYLAAILAIFLTLSLCACENTDAFPTDDQSSLLQVDNTTATTCAVTDATTEDTAPTHIHSYSSATCTTPASCSCGATEGDANGHSWNDATCLAPMTCAVCGITRGETGNHNFSGGQCATCGTADPDYTQAGYVWIPTNGGKRYHAKASCSNMKDPTQVTKSEAESQGFTPCKKCY